MCVRVLHTQWGTGIVLALCWSHASEPGSRGVESIPEPGSLARCGFMRLGARQTATRWFGRGACCHLLRRHRFGQPRTSDDRHALRAAVFGSALPTPSVKYRRNLEIAPTSPHNTPAARVLARAGRILNQNISQNKNKKHPTPTSSFRVELPYMLHPAHRLPCSCHQGASLPPSSSPPPAPAGAEAVAPALAAAAPAAAAAAAAAAAGYFRAARAKPCRSPDRTDRRTPTGGWWIRGSRKMSRSYLVRGGRWYMRRKRQHEHEEQKQNQKQSN